jgi:hypothetical protein
MGFESVGLDDLWVLKIEHSNPLLPDGKVVYCFQRC